MTVQYDLTEGQQLRALVISWLSGVTFQTAIKHDIAEDAVMEDAAQALKRALIDASEPLPSAWRPL